MQNSLLLIYAHPDDESFFAAGTIAKYAENGARVSLICATRGERGRTSDLCSIEDLPRIREAELRQAAQLLGIRELHFLPYEDQQLAAAPPEEIRRHLVTAIRRAQPQIVLTFDPNGSNLHSDHIAIGRFATDAVAASADPRWYPEAGPAYSVWRVLWPSHVPVFELSVTPGLKDRPGVDFVIDTGRWRAKKQAALESHRTQWAVIRKIFAEHGGLDPSFSIEAFRLGAGPRPAIVPADDLFSE
jgi:LmbE family N-acetylglucosaminyl deacetylase